MRAGVNGNTRSIPWNFSQFGGSPRLRRPSHMRHSFATYHVAAFRNPVETAYIMGHKSGTDMLDNSYKALVSFAEAEEF